MADEFRSGPPDAEGTTGSPDLLGVALAAYAAHLAKRARVRIPDTSTPWGRSARLDGLRRFQAR